MPSILQPIRAHTRLYIKLIFISLTHKCSCCCKWWPRYSIYSLPYWNISFIIRRRCCIYIWYTKLPPKTTKHTATYWIIVKITINKHTLNKKSRIQKWWLIVIRWNFITKVNPYMFSKKLVLMGCTLRVKGRFVKWQILWVLVLKFLIPSLCFKVKGLCLTNPF